MRKSCFLLSLLVLLCLSGCATTSRFGNIYNEAIATDRSQTIFKEGDFSSIKNDVNSSLKSVGYEKVSYSSPSEGFVVVVKDILLAKAMLIGDPHPYKIILKYTKAGPGKTRIDLVNGSPGLFTKDEVEQDIAKIVELIRQSE